MGGFLLGVLRVLLVLLQVLQFLTINLVGYGPAVQLIAAVVGTVDPSIAAQGQGYAGSVVAPEGCRRTQDPQRGHSRSASGASCGRCGPGRVALGWVMTFYEAGFAFALLLS